MKTESEARAAAIKLREELGSQWIIRVWYNFDWHWSIKLAVTNGYIEVFPRENKYYNYWIDSRLPKQFHTHNSDVKEGIATILADAVTEAEQTLQITQNLIKKI